jgi:molybdopterin synthase catalytic subunit
VAPQVTLARISETPLDTASCLAAVGAASAGGIGLFVGVVRDTDHERSVSALTYEAHPTAQATLEAVCAEVAAASDIVAVAAEHRIGDLAVGDIAVVVAVSAEHRSEALDTTRALIDAIKHDVPIWKHQRFADGTEEWVGCA